MSGDNDIAIVGIGCMFPGAENLEEFWKVLVNGEDHVQDIPLERFNVEAYYDPDPDHPYKSYIRKAGLLRKYDEWDNRFFGISDKEAESVDPQQHFVLESVHMALEDAGIPKEKIAGSGTGVFIGALNHDLDCVLRTARQKTTNTTVTGTDSSLLSARIAYFYNLLGPAITLNSACSSSMTAIHIASQALKNGEISMAITGGVNCILDPASFITLSSARMASPTGKCHTFSENADGYARGEGCGIVILKTLKDALRDKNKIWGTIFTGLNQDGHTVSPITSPSGKQQEQLLEYVFEKHKILPRNVQYIEAHGTGTTVGDFTEVSALGRFFSKYALHEIPIGSVKTNIGHIEPGAGVASLIKVLLMMKNKTFVKSLHAEPLNSKIPFKEFKLKVCQKVSSWKPNENGNRVASINCFGFGGTNTHAIVYDFQTQEIRDRYDLKTCLSVNKYVVLSANDLSALHNTARVLLRSLSYETSIEDLSSTTVHCRSHFNFRKVFVVDEVQKLITDINQFTFEELPVKMVEKEKLQVVFVYCGVATAWKSMCKYFITHDEIFKKTITEIDQYLSSLTNISVYSVFQNEEDLSDPLKNHLAIFACQIGLTEMWKHVGIFPDCIVGQSVGEVAAAYASKTLSLKDAVNVIYWRSQNLAIEGSGRMIVVQNCDINSVDDKCKTLRKGKANIAVYHSPYSCAVSGDETAIEEFIAHFNDTPVKIIPLNVKCAYHSHLTMKASSKLKETLKGIPRNNPCIPVISTVTGKLADELFGSPSYWAANVSEPVLFQNAIEESKRRNASVIYLEIGPNPVLKTHLSHIFPDAVEDALPSMKKKSELETFQKSFIELFCKGVSVIWDNVVPIRYNNLPIPQYQFSKRKHLKFSERMKTYLREHYETTNTSTMLISKVPGNAEKFSMVISKENTPFVYEHIVEDNAVVPAALYGEVALEIGNILFQNIITSELDVSWTIHRVLFAKEEEQIILIQTKWESQQGFYFEVFTAENTTSPLSSGRVTVDQNPRHSEIDFLRLKSILQSDENANFSYLPLRILGFKHGPMYQSIKKIAIRNKEIVCEICISNSIMKDVQKMYLHPVIIDTMFQSCSGAGFKSNDLFKLKVLPARVFRLVANQKPTQRMICYTTILSDNEMKASFDIILMQENGNIIAEIRGFEAEKINSPDSIRFVSYYEAWKSTELKLEPKPVINKVIYVFSWNKEYISLIENAFHSRQEGVKICPMLLTQTIIPDALQKHDITENMSVIFAPGLPGIDDYTTGDHLFNSVNKMTTTFLHLLKLLHQNKINILVVTNKTQLCGACNVHVLGTELWGMVRTVKLERTELSFTLLDIDTLSEFALNTIVLMSTNIEYGSKHVPREYAIREHVLYANELTKSPEDFHIRSYKSSLKSVSKPVCIRRQNNENETHFFGINSIEKEFDHSNLISVRPIQACVCNEETFFFFKKNEKFNRLDRNITGEEIIICEVIGRATIGKTDNEVVACCLTELKTELKIDREYVFEKSSLKGYKIGYMHAIIIAQAIAELLDKRTCVLVQCSQKNYLIYHFLRVLLKKKNCTIEYQDQSGIKWTQHTHVKELIVLANRGYVETTTFRLHYPNLQRCISLKGILPLSMVDRESPFELHVIDVEELFKPPNIKELSQMAFKLLKEIGEQDIGSESSKIDVTEITEHLEIRTPEENLIREDSAYIVVGGLTGLGWLIVKYLAKRKASTIITFSRRSLTNETEQRFLNIKHIHGVNILHRAVDITHLEDLTRTMQCLQQDLAGVPIRGVFQGAGVLKDRTALKMTQEEFQIPLPAKILGTWNLHHVTKHMELDIFLMHSSIASVFGNYSQTNYAAANAFLDSFAHYRRSIGLPGQTINWGALDVGMGSDASLQEIFSHKGTKVLSENQIQNCLTQMLISDRTQGLFADIDIKELFTFNNLKWEDSKYAGIVPEEEEMRKDKHALNGNTETAQNIIDLIKQISAQVLLVDVSELNETNSLVQFGVDSQNAIEIINSIFSVTNVRIPLIKLLSGGITINDLGLFLKERMESESMAGKINADGGRIYGDFAIRKQFEYIKQTNSVLVFSYEISADINKPELLKKILQLMIRVNPSVRVVDNTGNTNSSTSQTITDIEDFMLPFKCVEEEQCSSQMIDRRDKAISVAYINMKYKGILHIFCNRAYFDVFCGRIFSRDLQNISEYVVANQRVPEWLNKTNFDIVSLGSSKLHTVANSCITYFKNHLLSCQKPASLKLIDSTLVEIQNNEVSKINIPFIDMSGIQDLASENSWTIGGIVASAFQIILNQVTNVDRIPVMMEVDVRAAISECNDQMAACSNFIPIMSPDMSIANLTIQQIVNEINTNMKESIPYSIFPYVFTKELPEFNNDVHECHSFLFDTESGDHQYIKMKSTSLERHADFETLLYASHSLTKGTLSIEFHFCQKRVSNNLAVILCDYLSRFLQALPKIFTKPLFHLQSHESLLEGGTVLLPPGPFVLQTLNDNIQPVLLYVQNGFPLTLTWKSNTIHQTELSEFKHVDFIQSKNYYELHLQYIHEGDPVTFRTPDFNVCRKWWDFLRSHLPSSGSDITRG